MNVPYLGAKESKRKTLNCVLQNVRQKDRITLFLKVLDQDLL